MLTSHSSTETLVQQYEDDILQPLYDSLRCPNPSCRTYLYPPIYLCSSGHSLCVDCTEGDICCLCKKSFLGIRNSALEDIAQKMMIQCKNHHDGCDQVFPASHLSKHEQECEHRLYQCFSPKCPWFGRRWDIASHMNTVHSDKVFSGSKLVFQVDSSKTGDVFDDIMMVLYCSERFWARFVYYKEEAVLFAAVQYIGRYKCCSKFRYEVSLVVNRNDESRKRLVYQRETHNIGSDFKSIFHSKDCFCLRLDKERYYMKDNFVVTIKIDELP